MEGNSFITKKKEQFRVKLRKKKLEDYFMRQRSKFSTSKQEEIVNFDLKTTIPQYLAAY